MKIRSLMVVSLILSSFLVFGQSHIFSDRFQKFGVLNDTGVLLCANGDSSEIDCPVTDYPNQDAEIGRDADAKLGNLYKVGSGLAGFDFTKLDSSGQPLSAGAAEWACVRDNHTGLIWEVKSADSASPRYKDHTYSWFSSNGEENGGQPGVEDGGFCTGGSCDTQGYVSLLDGMKLCGRGSWRLPTSIEFLTIFNRALYSPAIDVEYFPGTSSTSHYWTSESNSTLPTRAWTVGVSDGRTIAISKESAYRVRLVSQLMGSRSSEQRGRDTAGHSQEGVRGDDYCDNDLVDSTAASDDFEDVPGGIVKHVRTGLEWQRCAVGQQWSDGECTGSPTPTTWQQALEVAKVEHSGWRVPNVNELSSIVERCKANPSVNPGIFPDAPASEFWSSTPDVNTGSLVWVVDFYSGRVSLGFKGDSSSTYLRLVR